jgi:hypothetical protein
VTVKDGTSRIAVEQKLALMLTCGDLLYEEGEGNVLGATTLRGWDRAAL